MLLAGYETTANTLAYCIYFISKTPHVQEKLLQEVDQFKGCSPGYDDLASFPYARAVVNEALRLYPPGPQLSRTALEDVQVAAQPCADSIAFCCTHLCQQHCMIKYSQSGYPPARPCHVSMRVVLF